MLRTILEPNGKIAQDDINSFALRHQLVLPPSYVAFLLRYNGGQPEPAGFPIEGLADNPLGAIQVFFGIKAKNPTEDLDRVLTEECSKIPHGVVPIACTEGDDFVCIDLRDPGCPVLFWDRRLFWGSNLWNEQDLYSIAQDFDSFLANLREID